MTAQVSGLALLESNATEQLMLGLAAMLRADRGYPSCDAVVPLRRSAFLLNQIGGGDAERLALLARKWQTAPAPPMSAELDRQFVSEQIAEFLPGWFG